MSGVFLNENELADMHERADEWAKDPAKMRSWAETNARVYMLILDHIARKAGGRRGPQDQMLAIERQFKAFDTMARAGLFGHAAIALPGQSEKDSVEDFEEGKRLIAEGTTVE